MFSDVRGFTRFAESLSPERVMAVLNRYHEEMSEAILAHGGTVVTFTGDGIMAVFGAPLERDDHADRAVAAAREMVQPRLPRFNRWLQSQAPGQAFRIGIGLSSGALISGFVGSARRMEYTALGDTTNTAARLEAMTKGTPHQVFIADATRSMLVGEPPDLVYIDEFEVSGKSVRVKVWSLREENGQRSRTT
jgi:adenylate cyclase